MLSEVKNCTGCFACRNICPKDAVTIAEDQYGNIKPVINKEKCISCGMCRKVCPEINFLSKTKSKSCFAAWSKNDYDVVNSSSGGIAAVLSRNTVLNNGIVYGAVSKKQDIFHARIEKPEELEELRGSKYVQSDIGLCFRQVKSDLLSGRKVLFTGTPCQIAGLKNYLGGNKKSFENLLTVDLICHGTPPAAYLKEHLNNHIKNADSVSPKWSKVTFRGKSDFILNAYNDQGNNVYSRGRKSDVYFSSFLSGLIFRECCYHCRYSSPERAGDLTIGDFLGFDRSKLYREYEGKISLILPNTDKGAQELINIQNDLYLKEFPLEEALKPEQINLQHPTAPHKERKIFLQYYPKEGFNKAILKTKLGKKVNNRYRIEIIMKYLPFLKIPVNIRKKLLTKK